MTSEIIEMEVEAAEYAAKNPKAPSQRVPRKNILAYYAKIRREQGRLYSAVYSLAYNLKRTETHTSRCAFAYTVAELLCRLNWPMSARKRLAFSHKETAKKARTVRVLADEIIRLRAVLATYEED